MPPDGLRLGDGGHEVVLRATGEGLLDETGHRGECTVAARLEQRGVEVDVVGEVGPQVPGRTGRRHPLHGRPHAGDVLGLVAPGREGGRDRLDPAAQLADLRELAVPVGPGEAPADDEG